MSGGTTEKGTVTLGTVAPAGGIQVQLEGDQYLGVPNAVVVCQQALLRRSSTLMLNHVAVPDIPRSEFALIGPARTSLSGQKFIER